MRVSADGGLAVLIRFFTFFPEITFFCFICAIGLHFDFTAFFFSALFNVGKYLLLGYWCTSGEYRLARGGCEIFVEKN